MQSFYPSRPFARLQPATPAAFQFRGGFWEKRRQSLRQIILPQQFQKIRETKRLENFYRAAGKSSSAFSGFYFNDSDLYKWLEAAAWTQLFDPDPEIQSDITTAIKAIEAAQQPDGYLDTYFMFEKAGDRWTNLRDLHELYCAGHLFEAAVAHHYVTQSDPLLKVALKLADHIVNVFGPQGRQGVPGHPEVELALVKLFEDSGEKTYLHLAESFINNRGKGLIGGRSYHQDHIPFRDMEHLAGHAVRAVYLCSGVTDIYQLTGDNSLRSALERLWKNMQGYQVYVSGGIGSRYEGEAFGKDFELPNERAYTETCAAIASLFWNQRMLQTAGESCYADLMEWTLYNAVLPGISLDGTGYFYVNPLADDGNHRRQEWFDCACCPPNIARVLASLPVFFFSQSFTSSLEEKPGTTVWLHSYPSGSLNMALPDAQAVTLEISGEYPWMGIVEIEVQGLENASEFTIGLRIPGWCVDNPRIWINGKEIDAISNPGSYVFLFRRWIRGDQIKIDFPLSTRWISSHPYVLENTGRVALARGPILYCLEAEDHPGVDLRQIVLPLNRQITQSYQPGFLNGVVTLEADGLLDTPHPTWVDRLYQDLPTQQSPTQPIHIKAIPYFAWANRQAGQLQTWLKVG